MDSALCTPSYLSREPVGQCRKFQHIYDGPFTVTCLPSAHLVILRDPSGKRNFRRPVHINRLKLAQRRVPLPAPYFNQQTDESENTSSKSDNSTSSVDRDTSENSKSISTNVTTGKDDQGNPTYYDAVIRIKGEVGPAPESGTPVNNTGAPTNN